MTKVIVGLSGGVDSSVAAMLLKNQGYEVIGIFLRNWSFTNEKCYWLEDSIDALLICRQLNIPFHIIDMSIAYKKLIIDYLFKEYCSGRTPNPDIICNRELKFNFLIKQYNVFNANVIATGHYVMCKKINKNFFKLEEGIDKLKDQSYFLCQLNQEQLSKSIFPLGIYNKKEVRKKAIEAGLITSKKKDSQGLCFLGKIRLSDFLQSRLICKLGDIIEISSIDTIYISPTILSINNRENFISIFKKKKYIYKFGKKIGHHYGVKFFTKGQRKGLRIGGFSAGLFVIDTDIENNIVYVGMRGRHPGLYKSFLFIKKENIHWIRENLTFLRNDKINVKCRFRYKQDLQCAKFKRVVKGLYIIFEYPQKSITEGQFATWYLNEELIGSGIIS